ncbi:opsin family protein [Aspergillus saccharolyticus JOP 1030-1]|uniref:Family A G protein-coupled receptor-like protein n=1 Tax=Aspergillus saccharolyticus JOP 1030-1 TaxID=1450539 RepID=A0A318ZBB6_9EURO|nr:family A G protein-coupled receptor-like protein [Aspergillus saccharolyticus JOP 1030-1]PYH43634.1 family A G protein-coupled receptor-like protein [Aspergillus saccharolyticus JOP 1030-1]
MIESFITATFSEPSPTSVAPIPTVVPGNEPIFQEIHDTGKRTLWVVTVLMALSSLVFYVLGARVPLTKRVFHTLVSLAATTSFIIYLALATGGGITWKLDTVKVHNKHVPNTHQDYFRQVLWLRYVLWFLTEPLQLLSLGLLSGLPGAHLLVAIAADFVMLGSGLLGTFAGHTSRRWVWFTISAIGYLTTVYHISVNGARAASNKDNQTRKFFGTISGVTLLVKVLFPVTIAAGALALKINVDLETILFAIYDIFSQGLIGYWLIIAHDSAPGITLNVDGFWSQGLGNEGAIRIGEDNGA